MTSDTTKRLTELGVQVWNATLHSATRGITRDDRHILYAVMDGAYGANAHLACIDINSGNVLEMLPIPGGISSWAATTATDGSVYIGSTATGHLYRYVPGSGFVMDLGVAVKGETYVFCLSAGADGVVYGGTYNGACFFEYSPQNGFKVFPSDPVRDQEDYVRTMHHDVEHSITYLGIGSHAHLVRYDHKTGQSENLLPEDPDNTFVHDIQIEGGKLFVRKLGSMDLMVFQENDNAADNRLTLEQTIPKVQSFGVSPLYDGCVYFTVGSVLHRYDIEQGTIRNLELDLKICPLYMMWERLDDQSRYPGMTLIGINYIRGITCMVRYNPEKHFADITELDMKGAPTNINSILIGPDGLLYSSGYLVGGMGMLNPETAENKQFKGLGQAEGICSFGDKLYFGVYPGARIYEVDPSRPWSDADGTNPKLLFSLKENGQDRPFGIAAGDGKLFFGTVASYGKLGGALTLYDPATGEREVLESPAGNLSLLSLVYLDGKVYAGTSIWGGLGIKPCETEAPLFVYDTRSGISELIPLPVRGFTAITAITLGPDGLVWGIAEGFLFAYNPHTSSFEWYEHALPEIRYVTGAIWRDAYLLAGSDGFIYGTSRAGLLFRIHPIDKKVTVLERGEVFFLLAEDDRKRLYFTDGGARLLRYTL
ncbi:hypothetical protein [Paenibacillus sp. HJGM_3]|uniref:hypothetical protein n=1 Tax=Paenibacillus sp. HJGM_3 TaxID=3379816 RepID=UPI00385D2CC3